MDHRPFEDWLLDNQELTAEQQHQLNSHLRTCASCAAIAEVNLALSSVREAAPLEGFADRFQVRLAARKQAQRRRNTLGFFILVLSTVVALGWLAWPLLKGIYLSPVNVLGSWMASLTSVWVSVQAVMHTGAVLLKVIPGFIPAYVWIGLLVVGGGLGLVWVASLIKFTKVPQGVKL